MIVEVCRRAFLTLAHGTFSSLALYFNYHYRTISNLLTKLRTYSKFQLFRKLKIPTSATSILSMNLFFFIPNYFYIVRIVICNSSFLKIIFQVLLLLEKVEDLFISFLFETKLTSKHSHDEKSIMYIHCGTCAIITIAG